MHTREIKKIKKFQNSTIFNHKDVDMLRKCKIKYIPLYWNFDISILLLSCYNVSYIYTFH